MNKKGQSIFGIHISAGGVFIVICILLLIGLVIFFNNQYTEQYEKGDNLLNSLTIDANYTNPLNKSTKGQITPWINGSDIEEKVEITITYFAYNSDKSQSKEIEKPDKISYPSLKMPFKLNRQIIDTAPSYFELGNNALFCVKVNVIYKIKGIARIFGKSPSKPLERCESFLGQF